MMTSTDRLLDASPALQLIARVRGEFEEMPGMRLTLQQAERLFGLSDSQATAVLDSLVRSQFLRVAYDGRYERWMSDSISRRPTAKAGLKRFAAHTVRAARLSGSRAWRPGREPDAR